MIVFKKYHTYKAKIFEKERVNCKLHENEVNENKNISKSSKQPAISTITNNKISINRTTKKNPEIIKNLKSKYLVNI